MKKVVAIVGPTAVGKTALSIQLAQRFQGEIISGDSMQVYRTLDIGTAKATPAEQAQAPHHLIDIRELTAQYSAADFQKAGRQLIEEIHARGHLPIVVGGTGLYIQALLMDYDLGGPPAEDSDLRMRLTAEAEAIGPEAMWQRLAEVDPQAAAKIHFNNSRKVVRALEVFLTTGRSIVQAPPPFLYDAKIIGLTTEREVLYQRINQRVDLMVTQGLLAEAEKMVQYPESQAAQAIGYKEFFPYFAGEIALTDAIEQVKQDSRRYAKRQLTWFRNRLPVEWWDLVQQPTAMTALEEEIAVWLERSKYD